MDLKGKQKIVKLIGAAEIALTRLEESVNALEAQGKTPPKSDRQLLKSIHRALDSLKRIPLPESLSRQGFGPKNMKPFPISSVSIFPISGGCCTMSRETRSWL